MTDLITTTSENGVLTITLNRPDKKNAITSEMYQAMADAVTSGEGDQDVRVILLTGAADSFTAGNDLKDFVDNPPLDPHAPVFQFMTAIASAQKPVVAAVNGLAIGIGTTVLLHCDLVYAVPDAKFRLPFVDLGLVPELASSLLLPLTVGPKKASELLLLGEMFGANEALTMGLITEIVDGSEILSVAFDKAMALAAKPPSAVRTTKKLLKSDGVLQRIQDEAQLFGQALQSAELKEAVSAFFEKRPPDFSKFS